jgi:short-subunit dehydrogenase
MSTKVSKSLDSVSHVVVTGGSSGIGKCFIATIRHRNTSIRFCNISRSAPDDFLLQEPHLHVAADLEKAAECARAAALVEAWAGPEGGRVLLINNSGFGSYGTFADLPLEHELSMIDLNCRAVVDLTHRTLPLLKARGGAILNVASTAAWQPTPFMATYGATKAFLLHWSLALNAELKGTGVHATALCPGPTESNFFNRAGFKSPPKVAPGMSAEAVVDFALRRVAAGASCPVSGFFNRLMASMGSKIPKSWQAPITKAVLKQTRLDQIKGQQ